MTTDDFLGTKPLKLKDPFEGYVLPYSYLKRLLEEYAQVRVDELKNNSKQCGIADAMLRFRLRLNIDEWGAYRKGDEDSFDIRLHDEQNGLTRFPIDKRWDVISCEIVNVV